MMKNYFEVRDWLESFIPYTYSKEILGLERIKYLLKLLGNPQEKFKSILIGGTSGKGSTAFYLARALKSAQELKSERVKGNRGLKIGLHVSPHLTYIGERMRIFKRVRESESQRDREKSGEISVKRLVGLINEIKPVVEAIISKQPRLTPSYFEILVAASFLYFAQEKVDWAVVEVGLGGRLDATNVLFPEVCVITNVGLDHTEILGNTIEKIAREKAGIIKQGVPIVTGCSSIPLRTFGPSTHSARSGSSSENALEVIKKIAKEKNAPLITISTLKTGDRAYYDLLRNVKAYIDDVIGDKFQVTNECFFLVNLVLDVIEIRPDKSHQLKAFSAGFEARFEQIDEGVVIDGAHNRDKVGVLIKWVKNKIKADSRQQTADSIILVCGFKKGKDWKGMLRLLLAKLDIESIYATQFVTTTDTGFFGAVEPEEISDYVKSKWKVKVESFQNSQEAVWEAINANSKPQTAVSSKQSAVSSQQLVLVTGSLYLAGEVRTIWKLPSFT